VLGVSPVPASSEHAPSHRGAAGLDPCRVPPQSPASLLSREPSHLCSCGAKDEGDTLLKGTCVRRTPGRQDNGSLPGVACQSEPEQTPKPRRTQLANEHEDTGTRPRVRLTQVTLQYGSKKKNHITSAMIWRRSRSSSKEGACQCSGFLCSERDRTRVTTRAWKRRRCLGTRWCPISRSTSRTLCCRRVRLVNQTQQQEARIQDADSLGVPACCWGYLSLVSSMQHQRPYDILGQQQGRAFLDHALSGQRAQRSDRHAQSSPGFPMTSSTCQRS